MQTRCSAIERKEIEVERDLFYSLPEFAEELMFVMNISGIVYHLSKEELEHYDEQQARAPQGTKAEKICNRSV